VSPYLLRQFLSTGPETHNRTLMNGDLQTVFEPRQISRADERLSLFFEAAWLLGCVPRLNAVLDLARAVCIQGEIPRFYTDRKRPSIFTIWGAGRPTLPLAFRWSYRTVLHSGDDSGGLLRRTPRVLETPETGSGLQLG
jgi:hypothetical protein